MDDNCESALGYICSKVIYPLSFLRRGEYTKSRGVLGSTFFLPAGRQGPGSKKVGKIIRGVVGEFDIIFIIRPIGDKIRKRNAIKMKSSIVKDLRKLGQSIWLDNLSRRLIESGELKRMIDLGLLGVTSNPTIFERAISGSADYDERIKKLTGKPIFEIYDELTIADIAEAADLFRPVYDETQGLDGYLSLEPNPKLAYKAEETIAEVKRLHKKVNRRNVMFKVPGTDEGLPAIEALISEGINVNATLIFSVEQYEKVARTYLKGITKCGSGEAPRSVASIFVSRIDTAVDKLLKREDLKGKAAVANSKLIYQKYLEIFNDRKDIQRVLWASTSTKNPAYSDLKYVEELVGKNTVNTVPNETWAALLDHGKAIEAITKSVGEARKAIADLKTEGIDISEVCRQLLADGVVAFERSFDSLLKSIQTKASKA